MGERNITNCENKDDGGNGDTRYEGTNDSTYGETGYEDTNDRQADVTPNVTMQQGDGTPVYATATYDDSNRAQQKLPTMVYCHS